MVHAEINRQLMIRTDNNVGALARIMHLLAEVDINIIAMCAYEVDDSAAIMFVSDDNNGAKRVLEKFKYNVVEEEIILLSVDNKAGALGPIMDKIAAEGVDLTLVYGSVEPEAKVCRNVIIARNNLDVMMVIKTEFERH